MRKATMLTSFVIDEISSQARYQDHLRAAEHRHLLKVAQVARPSLPTRMSIAVGDCLITWGLWMKARARVEHGF